MKDLLTHDGAKPFKCKVCSYQSKWEGNVRAHEKRQHCVKHAKIASKKTCPKMWENPDVTRNVISLDSREGRLQCTECDYKTNNRRLLISHRKVHSDQRPFPCTFPGCSYRTKWSHWVRAHERKVQNGWVKPASLKPPVDAVVAAAIDPLKLPDVSRCKYNEKVQCPRCGKQVLGRSLHHHALTHTDLRPYGCSDCSYRSRWPGDVKLHEQRMHSDAPAKKAGGTVGPELDVTEVSERVDFASRIRARLLVKKAAKLLRQGMQKSVSESGHLVASQQLHERAQDPTDDDVDLSSDISRISQDAIPPDSTFACMLCTFVGTTLESAIVHAATHNSTAISDQNNQ